MAFTEFYAQTTGDNLNAGSTTADAAPFTYAGGTFVRSTGVFTVASGNPLSDGVAVGDFASVYTTAGATVATFIGRVTARDATTITVSTTAISGATSSVSETAAAATCKVGGAWKGPNGTVSFPFGFVAATMTNSTGNIPRVNVKGGTNYDITAAMTHNIAGPVHFEGYTSSVGDGGRATIDGGTSGASYVLLTVGASTDTTVFKNLILQNNGATGAAHGLTSSVATSGTIFWGCVVNSVRGIGFCTVGDAGSNLTFVECEAYTCNQSNTAAYGGFGAATTASQSCTFIRCISHDNAGSNSSGFVGSNENGQAGLQVYIGCIADTNGQHGWFLNNRSMDTSILIGCDSYANAGSNYATGTGARIQTIYMESCNHTKAAAYGFINQNNPLSLAYLVNNGFGAGTEANTSGAHNNAARTNESGTVTYASNASPYNAPTTGDFRIALATAKGAGRGSFTETQASYTGTVGYPDIGAAQHLETASGGTNRAALPSGLSNMG